MMRNKIVIASEKRFLSMIPVSSSPQTRDADVSGMSKSIISGRFMSSGAAAASDLSSMLSREIAEEHENQTLEVPDELDELKREIESDWRVVDGPGTDTGLTRMYKREAGHNGSKIMVEFHCQENLAAEMEEEVEGGEEAPPGFRYSVKVSRAGKCLVFDCVTESMGSFVTGVVVRDDDGEGHGGGTGGESRGRYQGPMLPEIAEDLQESFMAYLREECGITDNVDAFISMHADYREQVEYVNWLESVRNMVE